VDLLQVFFISCYDWNVVKLSWNKNAPSDHFVLGETVHMLVQSWLSPVVFLLWIFLIISLRHEFWRYEFVNHLAHYTVFRNLKWQRLLNFRFVNAFRNWTCTDFTSTNSSISRLNSSLTLRHIPSMVSNICCMSTCAKTKTNSRNFSMDSIIHQDLIWFINWTVILFKIMILATLDWIICLFDG
jgi:hypothetical protein